MKTLFFLLLTLAAFTANAQTVTTWKGNTIAVKAIAGADVTIAPVDPKYASQHVGWVQVTITVYPVYKGSENGLFTYRKNKQGVMTQYYLTAAQKAKMYKE